MKDVFVWLESLFALCFKFHLHISIQCRDVYRIESIISVSWYWYLSKWQINDTFNATFYYDINKDRASLTKKWMIFYLLNRCFVFIFLHHLENYGPWILLYCMLSIPKGKKLIFNGLVSYRIGMVLSVSVLYCS